MRKAGIIFILLCTAALFGGATQHPYVKDLTQELRQAGAIVKPKNPEANKAAELHAAKAREVQSQHSSLHTQASDEERFDAPVLAEGPSAVKVSSVAKLRDETPSNESPLDKTLLDKPQPQALEQ